jgi:hypothetical protein
VAASGPVLVAGVVMTAVVIGGAVRAHGRHRRRASGDQ